MVRLPKWVKELAEHWDIPQKTLVPWYIPSNRYPRSFLLGMGSKAIYRVWQRDRNYGVTNHYIRITNPEELDMLSDHIRDDPTWYCHFLWFYEYPSLSEWMAVEKAIEEIDKEILDKIQEVSSWETQQE